MPACIGYTAAPVLPYDSSDAASGWAGWALAHPEFGSSVYPITTRGADYAHHITASPPGFEKPVASLDRQEHSNHTYPNWSRFLYIYHPH
jgi:hypothetical protein